MSWNAIALPASTAAVSRPAASHDAELAEAPHAADSGDPGERERKRHRSRRRRSP